MAADNAYPVGTIAKLLKLTERRCQQLADEGVLVRVGRGKYDLVGSVQGYIGYLQARTPDAGAKLDLNQERARLAKVNADIAEIELEKLKGVVVDAEAAKFAWEALATQVRTNLLNNVPVRVASKAKSETAETKIKAIVRDEITAALRALAEQPVESYLPQAEGAEE